MYLEDPALAEELRSVEGNEEEIKDRFAVALKFGTAGLRGVLGAGSNRIVIADSHQLVSSLSLHPVSQPLRRLPHHINIHPV